MATVTTKTDQAKEKPAATKKAAAGQSSTRANGSRKTTSAKAAAAKTETSPAAAVVDTKATAKPKTATAKRASTAKAATGTKPKTARSNGKAAQPKNRQSRDSSMTSKEHDDHADRAWTLADRIGIAMFVTWDGERQRARPLAATVKKEEGAIYFLTDISGEKDEQISEFPYVSVNFSDNRKARYVVFSGKAVMSNDRAMIKELWSPFAKAWWDSPEDPNIRLIKMTPEDAELWDSPGRLVSTVSMLTAAVTGKSPKMGENAKIVLH